MRLRNGILATALVASMGTGALPATAEATSAAADSGTVTLLTGDRVTVTGQGYHIEPGPQRKVRFEVTQRDGDLRIVPSDAKSLLAQGLLDERLFNVTQLLKWGYGDAQKNEIPLITQSASGEAAVLGGARQARQLAGLGLATMNVPKAEAARTWQAVADGARTRASGKIWLDGQRSPTLDRSVAQIGAPQAWQQGLTGAGVTVAVLDSGYDPDHPDLKGVVAHSRNFTDDPDPTDRNGHGTHVSATLAGAGDKYKGVAPGAKLAVGKIGNDRYSESALLVAMRWAAVDVKAKIVSLSLGGLDTPDLDPVEQAVNTLSEQTGTLFVIAAGNSGSEPGTVGSPGSSEAALTVGAVDKSDKMARFSGRGPRAHDHAVKPDVTAPGVDIVAAAAKGTSDGSHVAMSGTSMAAPHVAGAAAILAQKHPTWTGRQLKAALTGSAAPQPGTTLFDQGAGRVDVLRAVTQQVVATPANLHAAFPYGSTGGRVATREIVYTNAADTPVTLDLTVEGETLRLSAQRVEIPAKGSTPVTVTIDAEGKAPGDYPGTVTAKAGDQVVRTVANAWVEPESYDVRFTAVDRTGAPASASGYAYTADGQERDVFLIGSGTYRLPPGEWNFQLGISGSGDEHTTTNQMVNLTESTDVKLDARQGKPLAFTVDDPTAAHTLLEVFMAHGWLSTGIVFPGIEANMNFAIPVKRAGFTFIARSVWHKRGATPSPYRYDLAIRGTDGIPENLTHATRTEDLAKVTTTFRGAGVATTGAHSVASEWTEGRWTYDARTPDLPMPGTLIQYRTPAIAWRSILATGNFRVMDTGRRLAAGHTRETWNAAVSGPSFATPAGARDGDRLTFNAARLFSDAAEGRTGMDADATGSVTLAKNGQVIAKTDYTRCEPKWPNPSCILEARLPAEAATYTLTATGTRQVPHSTLSTSVEATWTFRSARTPSPQALPLTAVRYAPHGLDDHNRAKPGSTTTVPIWTERNPGAAKAQVKSLRLEMSADDGATWTTVLVKAVGPHWAARIANPAAAGFVSLRATATDGNGDTVTQTVRRAYAIG
ncbi:S8 family serine peptidase [Nonomuraea longicatena]|uniref:S8 family serine peptidase n=1 Tax=Nonomuraea longicatena TaxID=83682 RepID=A0ABN1Q4X0_9ACTN